MQCWDPCAVLDWRRIYANILTLIWMLHLFCRLLWPAPVAGDEDKEEGRAVDGCGAVALAYALLARDEGMAHN